MKRNRLKKLGLGLVGLTLAGSLLATQGCKKKEDDKMPLYAAIYWWVINNPAMERFTLQTTIANGSSSYSTYKTASYSSDGNTVTKKTYTAVPSSGDTTGITPVTVTKVYSGNDLVETRSDSGTTTVTDDSRTTYSGYADRANGGRIATRENYYTFVTGAEVLAFSITRTVANGVVVNQVKKCENGSNGVSCSSADNASQYYTEATADSQGRTLTYKFYSGSTDASGTLATDSSYVYSGSTMTYTSGNTVQFVDFTGNRQVQTRTDTYTSTARTAIGTSRLVTNEYAGTAVTTRAYNASGAEATTSSPQEAFYSVANYVNGLIASQDVYLTTGGTRVFHGTYVYDSQNRLTAYTYDYGTIGTADMGDSFTTYAYDDSAKTITTVAYQNQISATGTAYTTTVKAYDQKSTTNYLGLPTLWQFTNPLLQGAYSVNGGYNTYGFGPSFLDTLAWYILNASL